MRNNNEGSRTELRSDRFMREAMSAYGKSIWHVALSQAESRAEAEDIYQDVFIALAKSRTEFEHGEHMKAWLLRVAVNKCLDAARTRQNRATDSIDDLSLDPGYNNQKFMNRDHEIWDAVRSLPGSMQIAIYLFYAEGYSCNEIAHLLDAEPSTIRTRLQRAREQLKHILGGVSNGNR